MPHHQPILRLIGVDELSPQTPVVLPIGAGGVPTAVEAAARIAGFTAKSDTPLGVVAEVDCLPGLRDLLLVGIAGKITPEAAGAAAAAALSSARHLAIDGRGLPRAISVGLVLGAALRAWRFPSYRQHPHPDGEDAMAIDRIDLIVDDPSHTGRRWQEAVDTVESVYFSRNLTADPSNLLTPAVFIERLRALEAFGVQVEVIPSSELASHGLGLLAAVGRGSVNPPALVSLRWPGQLDLPPVAFVGKGITFDTGGISVKPADGMWDMRGDMTGAAVCAGAMMALAKRQSPAPVTAVLALAENMLGAESYRPGDVLRSHHGLTVEVIDTDAEGRLVLADALSFAIARYKPRAVVDLATLTYAVVAALGQQMAGLYTNDSVLAAHLAAAGLAVDEPVWRLPMTDEQRESLASDIADLKQCLTGPFLPDASLGAAFLSRFVGETPWAHLDIGGMDAREEADARYPAGPTGFGVRLLDQLIALRYEDPDHP